jgi:hypothetical protein
VHTQQEETMPDNKPNKVENLGSAVLRRLIRDNGGGFTPDVARDLRRRLPGLDKKQLESLIVGEPDAWDQVLRYFLGALIDLCGTPDDPHPDHAAIGEMLKPLPPECRAELLGYLRDRMPWMVDGFDPATWKAKREAEKAEAIAFFDALELLAENGADLVFAFFNQVVAEYRRERASEEEIAARVADVCARMGLPRPPAGLDLYGLAEKALS